MGPMDNRLVATATTEMGMHKERAMDKAMKPTTRVTASRGKGMADIEQALLQFWQIDVCSPVWLIFEKHKRLIAQGGRFRQAFHWPRFTRSCVSMGSIVFAVLCSDYASII